MLFSLTRLGLRNDCTGLLPQSSMPESVPELCDGVRLARGMYFCLGGTTYLSVLGSGGARQLFFGISFKSLSRRAKRARADDADGDSAQAAETLLRLLARLEVALASLILWRLASVIFSMPSSARRTLAGVSSIVVLRRCVAGVAGIVSSVVVRRVLAGVAGMLLSVLLNALQLDSGSADLRSTIGVAADETTLPRALLLLGNDELVA
jgi:hypothetical protein